MWLKARCGSQHIALWSCRHHATAAGACQLELQRWAASYESTLLTTGTLLLLLLLLRMSSIL